MTIRIKTEMTNMKPVNGTLVIDVPGDPNPINNPPAKTTEESAESASEEYEPYKNRNVKHATS